MVSSLMTGLNLIKEEFLKAKNNATSKQQNHYFTICFFNGFKWIKYQHTWNNSKKMKLILYLLLLASYQKKKKNTS